MSSPARGSLFGRLLLLFTLVPLAELILLLWIGSRLGFWATVGLILVTAVVGATLARREGMGAWQRFNERLAAGGLPGKELTDGLIILVAGALLLTPGVLTDVAGLLGLFPPTRAWLRARLARRLQQGASVHFVSFGAGRFGTGGFGSFGPRDAPPPPHERLPEDDVQDATFRDIDAPGRKR